MYLPINTLLQGGKYRIVRFISSGGFGCTYEAEHVMLEKRVAIKEFFVKDFCNRDETTAHITVGTISKKGLVEKLRRKFIDEAKALCKLQHPGIVSVSDVFEENGTAYFVMDYVEGRSLSEIVREQGPLPEERAVRYIRAVATALQYVHDNNRLHLDIKPGNIMIDSNDNPVLIDFGASKQYDEEAGENTSTLMGKTPGYAPPEQMSNSVVKFLPATDIYALGATLYKLLTGITPPDAMLRISGKAVDPMPTTISSSTRNAVASAMQMNKSARPQSLSEFIGLLQSSGTDMADEETHLDNDVPVGVEVDDKPQPKDPKPQPKSQPKDPKPQSQPESQSKSQSQPEPQSKSKPQPSLWVRYKGVLIGAAVVVGVVIGMLLFRNPQAASVPDNPDPGMAEMPFDSLAIDTARVVLTPITSETEEERKTKEESELKATEESERKVKEEAERKAEEERKAKEEDARRQQAALNIEMVYVAGGTFTMGASSLESEANSNEKPAHNVTLSSYYIGKYEITQKLWEAVMGSNPSEFKGDNLPVVNVSWDDIQEFIRRLNARTGKRYRLPTEAEWEFAARGGNSSRGYKYSGSNNPDAIAWGYENSGNKPHAVGTKSPNELGIYDMSGNAIEWCQDWFDENYYSHSLSSNPKGPSSGDRRVLRGGSWVHDAGGNRVAVRYGVTPGIRSYNCGFRLAMDANDNNRQSAVSKVEAERKAKEEEVRRQQSVLNIEMVYVAGGTFTMGASSSDSVTGSWEKPAHSVTLSGYYIGKYEVTQKQWVEIMGSNPSYSKGDNLPIDNVSWDDVQEFIRKLNACTGKRYRLPTEAEWEFAARGGNSSRGYKYSGSDNLDAVAWYEGNSGNKTHAVGTKSPNELGIYDMSGNVFEFCQDWHGENYYSHSPSSNPQGPSSGTYRVLRGGSWYTDARSSRVLIRGRDTPDSRYTNYGFRLVLDH